MHGCDFLAQHPPFYFLLRCFLCFFGDLSFCCFCFCSLRHSHTHTLILHSTKPRVSYIVRDVRISHRSEEKIGCALAAMPSFLSLGYHLATTIALLCMVLGWSFGSVHAQPIDIEKTRSHFDKRSPLYQNLPDCRKNFDRITKQTTEKGTYVRNSLPQVLMLCYLVWLALEFFHCLHVLTNWRFISSMYKYQG